jgi:acyl-CoA thioesterase-1
MTPSGRQRRFDPRLWKRALLFAGLALIPIFVLSKLGGPPAPPFRAVTLIALGDSLTAGFGLRHEQAWPALAETALGELGWQVEIINAGVSGDTTADGLKRLPALLDPPPDMLLIALGGNDALQHRPMDLTIRDLRALVLQCQIAGVEVALIGVRLPVRTRGRWTDRLSFIYSQVSNQFSVPLLPNLFKGVMGNPAMLLSDGLHPNAAGQARMAAMVVDFLVDRHKLH